MTDSSHIQHLKAQLKQYTTNLRHLETQAAKFGGESNVPLYLMNDLRATRQSLDQLASQLRKLGVSIAPVTSTFQLPTTIESYNPEQTLRECQEYILDNLETLFDNPSRAFLSRIKHRVHTTFRMLDGERKGILLKFLYDERLIGYDDPTIMEESSTSLISLESADLRGIQATHLSLNGCNLARAHCQDGNFSASELYRINLYKAVCQDTIFSGAAMCDSNLRNTDLSNSILASADLAYADLRGAKLEDAILTSTNLIFAGLDTANLTGAILTSADLSGARFAGTIFNNTNLTNVTLDDDQQRLLFSTGENQYTTQSLVEDEQQRVNDLEQRLAKFEHQRLTELEQHLVEVEQQRLAEIEQRLLQAEASSSNDQTMNFAETAKARIAELESQLEYERINTRISNLTPGTSLEVRVSRIESFGAYVDLAAGWEGLIHYSNLPNCQVGKVGDFLKVGEPLDVSVIAVHPTSKRINLSVHLEQPKDNQDTSNNQDAPKRDPRVAIRRISRNTPKE